LTVVQQRALILIVDGLGDLPSPALDGLTPLEAACTPVLNRMAAAGCCGLVNPGADDEIPHTDSGVGLLFGLPAEQCVDLHRGPVEASGAGRPLRAGEIAVRANFATVEKRPGGLWVTDRRAGRITKRVDELAEVLDGLDLGDGIQAEFRPTDQHRGVLILTGPGLDAAVSDTDPGDIANPGLIRESRPLRPAAKRTAAKVNLFVRLAHQLLDGHPVNREREAAAEPPANGVITRGAGVWVQPPNRLVARGLRVAVVAGCNTVLGLARLFNFDTVHNPAFTAATDTDLDGKVAAALQALQNHDIVYVHVKAADLCAHDRDPLGKKAFLERLDRAVEPLASAGVIVALTADHTTDSNTGAHTADPVPSLLFDPSHPGPSGRGQVNFGEADCRAANAPHLRSFEFLDRILERILP